MLHTLFVALAFGAVCVYSNKPTPVVLWHGMGDNCCSEAMAARKALIENNIPGVYVVSLMIGTDTAQVCLSVPIGGCVLLSGRAEQLLSERKYTSGDGLRTACCRSPAGWRLSRSRILAG
jgi:hypothetical protein